MSALKKISGYSIMYSANSFSKRIVLYQGKQAIGQLNFYAMGKALPPDNETLLNGQAFYMLNYTIDSFAHCIQILNDTKEKYLLYNGSGGGFENAIQTLPPQF